MPNVVISFRQAVVANKTLVPSLKRSSDILGAF